MWLCAFDIPNYYRKKNYDMLKLLKIVVFTYLIISKCREHYFSMAVCERLAFQHFFPAHSSYFEGSPGF